MPLTTKLRIQIGLVRLSCLARRERQFLHLTWTDCNIVVDSSLIFRSLAHWLSFLFLGLLMSFFFWQFDLLLAALVCCRVGFLHHGHEVGLCILIWIAQDSDVWLELHIPCGLALILNVIRVEKILLKAVLAREFEWSHHFFLLLFLVAFVIVQCRLGKQNLDRRLTLHGSLLPQFLQLFLKILNFGLSLSD